MTSGVSAREAAPSKGPLTGAGDPVLISKITVPGVPAWAVRRPQIDKLIAEGTRGPLTTVTGPPGCRQDHGYRLVGCRPLRCRHLGLGHP